MSVTPVALFDNSYSAISSIGESASTNKTEGTTSFDTILSSVVDMYKEADTLQKAAEEAEMSFALGYTDSIHDLAVAQQKANISLQYTVKVTNAIVSAYKELMNMQL